MADLDDYRPLTLEKTINRLASGKGHVGFYPHRKELCQWKAEAAFGWSCRQEKEQAFCPARGKRLSRHSSQSSESPLRSGESVTSGY